MQIPYMSTEVGFPTTVSPRNIEKLVIKIALIRGFAPNEGDQRDGATLRLVHPPFPHQAPPRPSFRWGRGLLHVGLALVAVVVIFGTLAAVLPVADPQRFGEGVGRFAFFITLGALGVSVLGQTGRRAAAWAVGGLLVAIVIGVVVVVVTMAPDRGDAETRPLPIDDFVRADGVLRHPALGVSIPDPGASLQPMPELVRELTASTPGSRAWVYVDQSAGEAVMVFLVAELAADERFFTHFFEGIVHGQTEGIIASRMTLQERERSIRWNERRAHLYLVAGDMLHMRFDGFGLAGEEALVIFTSSMNPERFAGFAEEVKVP